MKLIQSAALGLIVLGAPAFADQPTGDAAAGEKTFRKCKACHVIESADETIVKGGKTGPNLYAIDGRVAGSDEDFGKKYGSSLQEAGEAGLKWNEDDFVKYVADPREFLKEYLDDSKAKSKMTYKLRKEEEAHDVWAYLVSVGPEPAAD